MQWSEHRKDHLECNPKYLNCLWTNRPSSSSWLMDLPVKVNNLVTVSARIVCLHGHRVWNNEECAAELRPMKSRLMMLSKLSNGTGWCGKAGLKKGFLASSKQRYVCRGTHSNSEIRIKPEAGNVSEKLTQEAWNSEISDSRTVSKRPQNNLKILKSWKWFNSGDSVHNALCDEMLASY